jgi:3-hydroxybutyryl-CoA dehydratase
MRQRAVSDLVEGQEVVEDFRVTDEDMEAFARLSGDRNPVHLDRRAAMDRGYQEPLVYGALLVARLSRLIGMQLPGPSSVWTELRITFHRPLRIGESARLLARVASVHPSTETVRLKFRIARMTGAIVAKGDIGVFLGDAR